MYGYKVQTNAKVPNMLCWYTLPSPPSQYLAYGSILGKLLCIYLYRSIRGAARGNAQCSTPLGKSCTLPVVMMMTIWVFDGECGIRLYGLLVHAGTHTYIHTCYTCIHAYIDATQAYAHATQTPLCQMISHTYL